MIPQQTTHSHSQELFVTYIELQEAYRNQHQAWEEMLSAIAKLEKTNFIIILGALILGFLHGICTSDDKWEIITLIGVSLIIALVCVFMFSLLWKIRYFFVRRSMKKTLLELRKMSYDIFNLKATLISQISLRTIVAEHDTQLATKFLNKRNKWLEAEYQVFQYNCVLQELQLKKMSSSEWQWIKYSFLVVVSIIAAIIAIYLLAVVLILTLVGFFLTAGGSNNYPSYAETPCQEEKLPSKHETLLAQITEVELLIANLQNDITNAKQLLIKWGAPEIGILKNDI